MKLNLQGLMWFECHEIGKEELLIKCMSIFKSEESFV